MQHYLIRPGADYSYTEGKEAAVRKIKWHSIYPKIWLERNLLRGGRLYAEYGLNYITGEGERAAYYRVNGFTRGMTHRLLAGMDIQMGKYIYGNGNYLLRKEPDSDELFQKLTVEIRAIF